VTTISRYDGDWAPYVPVAERRRQAALIVEKLRRKGAPVAPVMIAGRIIATTFWGRAWCDMMESHGDYASRLPRGRSYVKNGFVIDLRIEAGRVTALVSGSALYTVTITIKQTTRTRWQAICADCSRGIESVVELLQGRLSKGVMERICRQETGLFPQPSEIRFACSCPDHALMCKHVAAVLYGVGARLDEKPELLFRLRAVDEAELVAGIDTELSLSTSRPQTNKVLATDDMAALFGLDMAEPDGADQPSDASKGLKGRRGRGSALVSAPKPVSLRSIPREPRAIITDKATVMAPILKAVDSEKNRVAVKPSTTDARTPAGKRKSGQSEVKTTQPPSPKKQK
jgi:uncharacterized Zn finger protein